MRKMQGLQKCGGQGQSGIKGERWGTQRMENRKDLGHRGHRSSKDGDRRGTKDGFLGLPRNVKVRSPCSRSWSPGSLGIPSSCAA